MERTFIDLGLPSGILWAIRPLKGKYSHSEAMKLPAQYGLPDCHLPSLEEIRELIEHCSCYSNQIIGPSEDQIFVPLSATMEEIYLFWSKDNALGNDGKPLEDCDQAIYFGVNFNSNVIDFDASGKDYKMYVLLCKSK